MLRIDLFADNYNKRPLLIFHMVVLVVYSTGTCIKFLAIFIQTKLVSKILRILRFDQLDLYKLRYNKISLVPNQNVPMQYNGTQNILISNSISLLNASCSDFYGCESGLHTDTRGGALWKVKRRLKEYLRFIMLSVDVDMYRQVLFLIKSKQLGDRNICFFRIRIQDRKE